ncbi:hypothetical protein PISMIDRAFT_681180 [Pisolithus microcarpus 441]|uniref:Uncharacterized protein n=1 Tax=Pisolithus microcarpus 441 TaxID=765257 RepID=A0A0C9YXQ4_9AGAM|nr:hypothetical protein PISMIDRAFT_681180 [Pisolithus microcarpus 441]
MHCDENVTDYPRPRTNTGSPRQDHKSLISELGRKNDAACIARAGQGKVSTCERT